MINLFCTAFDQKQVANLFKKILKGAGSYNFEDGTGVALHLGLSNVRFEENFCGFYSLTFSLPAYDVECNVKMDNVEIMCRENIQLSSLYNDYSLDEIEMVIDKNLDDYEQYHKVKNLIYKFSTISPKRFKSVTAPMPFYSKIMGIDSINQAYCLDQYLGRFIIMILGQHTEAINFQESKKLLSLFSLSDTYLCFNKAFDAIVCDFDHTFLLLKNNKHDVTNHFNDNDNFIYFIENNNIQAVSYCNQNQMFLIAKDTITNVVKIWNSMQIDISKRYIPSNLIKNSIFNVIDYFNYMIYTPFGCSYNYPFEFDNLECRKSVDYLLNNFDTATSELIYSSKLGFVAEQYRYFNRLLDMVSYSDERLTDFYA